MKKEQGIILPIIMVALVVVLLGAAGYFAYKQYSAPKEQPEQITCTEEAKVCPDGSSVGRTGPNCEFAECPVVPDQTAGWKTYTNFGIEFKYPDTNEWNRINENTGGKATQISFGSSWFFIIILSNYNNEVGRFETFDEIIKNIVDNEIKLYDFNAKDVSINGKKGKQISYFNNAQSKPNIDVYFPIDNKSTIIFENNTSGVPENIFNQILSTFKLTDKIVDQTASWKTYTNDEYGFEIKYPNNWGILQTWRPVIDGIGGVVLGYRGEGDYIGIDVDIIFDKNKLKEFSYIGKKYLVEREGVSYLLFPNNVSDDEFNRIISTFKFTPVK